VNYRVCYLEDGVELCILVVHTVAVISG
jgi:hypothetical protein